MGFSDMTWKIVPPEPKPAPPKPKLRMRLACSAKGSGYLLVSRQVREQLCINGYVEVLVNGKAIAVRAADKHAQAPRTITKSTGQVTIAQLARNVFRMQPKESYRLDVEIEDGHAWAYLPDDVVRRMREGA